MGYELHITRASDWTDSDATPITLEEWRAYVESDPEMRMDGFLEGRDSVTHKVLRIEHPGLATWAHAADREIRVPFALFRADVSVNNPDEFVLAKMCAIAQALGARVQGDDGEFYPPETIQPGTFAAMFERSASEKGVRRPEEGSPDQRPAPRSWWRRLFGG